MGDDEGGIEVRKKGGGSLRDGSGRLRETGVLYSSPW